MTDYERTWAQIAILFLANLSLYFYVQMKNLEYKLSRFESDARYERERLSRKEDR